MKIYHSCTGELAAEWQKLSSPLFLHYTGSMFGLGCSATDPAASQRISLLKNRIAPGYLVLAHSFNQINNFIQNTSPALKGLIKQYSPGSLSVLLTSNHPKLKHLQVKGKIGFRIPNDHSLRQFLENMDLLLISTSINTAGNQPENYLPKIINQYKDWFDLALLPPGLTEAQGSPSTLISEENGNLICLRQGNLPFHELQEDFYHPLITFVCTGNICRSPLAEYYFRQQINLQRLNYRTSSAGTLPGGVCISTHSRDILAHYAMDASAHISTQITPSLAKRSRLVITMTQKHKDLLAQLGITGHNIITLAQAAGKQLDVADPYMMPKETYQRTFLQIKNYLDLLIIRLKQGEI